MTDRKCYLNALGIICAAGDSIQSIKERFTYSQVELTVTDQFSVSHALPLGLYSGDLPKVTLPQPKWQSRNNQMALKILSQIEDDVHAAIERYGTARVGVIIGTSTSGIGDAEPHIRDWARCGEVGEAYDYGLQEMGATAQFVAETLGVKGPVYGISTACSSGAKALASARRLLRAGICDAVIAGGVDTICKLTVHGFSSLEAVSEKQCNPFSRNRNGINIGEGGALFLVSAEKQGVELLGVGEGSDAHHISAPDPTGSGAMRTMQAALHDADLKAVNVGYVNLHGTATALNDRMESLAMHEVFGSETLCSSTKPFTGHTLGAAGAVEAGICWLLLNDIKESRLPLHVWDGDADPELPTLNFVSESNQPTEAVDYVVSNSFAFGGNNISLLLGRVK